MKVRHLCIAIGLIIPFYTAQATQTLHVAWVPSEPSVDGKAESIWENAPETVITLKRIPQAVIKANTVHQKGKYAKKWSKSSYTETAKLRLKSASQQGSYIFPS